MDDQEREAMIEQMQREVFAPENDDPRNVQLREQQIEIERLRAERDEARAAARTVWMRSITPVHCGDIRKWTWLWEEAPAAGGDDE